VITHPISSKNASIQIISTQGKKFKSYSVQEGAVQTSIRIAELKKGVYFLIFQDNNKRQTFKFIKGID
jgi:hypothetical protein